MAFYLIDFENVHEDGMIGVGKLKADDKVVVFYGSQIQYISFDRHVEVVSSKAQTEYIKTSRVAKNYLDFQLVTYVGCLIGQGEPGPFHIITKDTGFDSVVDFWKERGIDISRHEKIDGQAVHKQISSGRTHRGGRSRSKNRNTNSVADENAAVVPELMEAVDVAEAPVSEKVSDAVSGNSEIAAGISDAELSANATADTATGEAIDAVKTVAGDNADAEAAAPAEAPKKKRNRRKKVTEAEKADSTAAENTSTEETSPVAEPGSDKAATAEETSERDVPVVKKRRSRSSKGRKKNVQTEEIAATAGEEALAEVSEQAVAEVSEQTVSEADRKVEETAEQTEEKTDAQPEETEKKATGKATGKTSGKSTGKAAEKTAATLPEAFRKKVRNAVKDDDMSVSSYTTLYRLMATCPDKQDLNMMLVKSFGQEKANVLYPHIRAIFAEYLRSLK